MKIKFKKYLFLLNDLTNLLLKKDFGINHEKVVELHKRLKIVSIFLVLSLLVNIILLIKLFIYG